MSAGGTENCATPTTPNYDENGGGVAVGCGIAAMPPPLMSPNSEVGAEPDCRLDGNPSQALMTVRSVELRMGIDGKSWLNR